MKLADTDWKCSVWTGLALLGAATFIIFGLRPGGFERVRSDGISGFFLEFLSTSSSQIPFSSLRRTLRVSFSGHWRSGSLWCGTWESLSL